MIRFNLRRMIPLWICVAAPLLADITIRYQTTLKTSPAQPPQVREQMEKFQAAWGNSVMRMKNGKQWVSAGPWISIMDFAAQQITLLDSDGKKFATVSVADFPDKMAAAMPKPPEMPDAAKKAIASMKTSVQTRKTGRTETILGVQAEEREVVISMEMPVSPGGKMPAISMKMVMQVWNAKPEEALRNQAIRETTAYRMSANYFLNPARTLENVMGSLPAMAQSLKAVTEELNGNNGVMLRNRMSTYMEMPGQTEPAAPMFETNQEAVELSSAPLEEGLFGIPAGYTTIPVEDFLKTLLDRQIAMMGVPKPKNETR